MLPYKSVYLNVHLSSPSKTFSYLYPVTTAVLYSPFNIHFPLRGIINLELQADLGEKPAFLVLPFFS